MDVRKRSSCNKVPVGVFEAYVSLLDFVVLQFRHVVFIHRRLRHGLLKISDDTKEEILKEGGNNNVTCTEHPNCWIPF